MSSGKVSKSLLKQRIRNRIIELCEFKIEDIATCGAFSFINFYDDILPHGFDDKFHNEPVFTQEEQRILKNLCRLFVSLARATTEDMGSVQKIKQSRHWMKFISEMESAYEKFSKRGKFPEDEEFF